MLQPWDEFPEGGESLFLGVAEFCRTQQWLSLTHASDSPALVGQGTLVLSPGFGLTLRELAATTAHSCGGSSLPKPKLGHGCSSQAIRAGSSSVKLQSLAYSVIKAESLPRSH